MDNLSPPQSPSTLLHIQALQQKMVAEQLFGRMHESSPSKSSQPPIRRRLLIVLLIITNLIYAVACADLQMLMLINQLHANAKNSAASSAVNVDAYPHQQPSPVDMRSTSSSASASPPAPSHRDVALTPKREPMGERGKCRRGFCSNVGQSSLHTHTHTYEHTHISSEQMTTSTCR